MLVTLWNQKSWNVGTSFITFESKGGPTTNTNFSGSHSIKLIHGRGQIDHAPKHLTMYSKYFWTSRCNRHYIIAFFKHSFATTAFLDSNLRDCPFLFITGPKLPMGLLGHAMVELGNGQAIIGGGVSGIIQDKIYLFSCTNRYCSIHHLDQILSLPRYQFVAIPIPDKLSGCITGGKIFHKIYHVNLQLET